MSESPCINRTRGCRNSAPEDDLHYLELVFRGVTYRGFMCDDDLRDFENTNHDQLHVMAENAILGKRFKPQKRSIHGVIRDDLKWAVDKGLVCESELERLHSRGLVPPNDRAVHAQLVKKGLIPRRLPASII